ncbi:BlaR1 family beta-lactam sensor/signal transducer [Staphylococcus pseudoxylosus]|uniref:Methicillin resistance regulatory sensor-transducer MecR1 n=3 Tax=Staphylococcus TaxID=1279 RepID=K8DVN3_STAXY|nr:BlaR1 family beta-lactam sensor/signal transducer [Staphylococcus pseudoxylosus]MCE5002439.1 BlaR1 family beta-lactam sensor/signal transducer [Staphylococcus pseudoxylosus]RMI85440.1 BlaR1 family beta-lactam sensor/signal transducer [Staphylococcus pseudoxylosus]CCM44122.1 Methicillin resistance regulatory sensor-transducer MecR1 [Staphylococcus xylosus]
MLQQFLVMSIISSILTLLLIIIVRAICIKYFKTRLNHKIWLLVLLSLFLPLLPINNIVKVKIPSIFSADIISHSSKSSNHNLSNESTNLTKDLALNIQHHEMTFILIILLVVWFIGLLFFSFKFIAAIKQIAFIKDLSIKSSILDNHLKKCINNLNIKSKSIVISHVDEIENPMVFWLGKYYIVLPTNIMYMMDEEQIDYIISHELIHIKNKDLWSNYIFTFFIIMLWFNPALYVSKKLFNIDCEISCDNQVLKRLSQSNHQRYGEAILKCWAIQKQSVNDFAAKYLLGTQSNLKSRFVNISKFKSSRNRKLKMIPYVVLSILILLQGVMVSAHSDKGEYTDDIKYTNLKELDSHFLGFNGSFVLFDNQKKEYFLYNEKESRKRYTPDSTYKLYLALIGFDRNVMSLNNTEQKWDGKENAFKEWNQNQNLNSAMRYSVNWYFENINNSIKNKELKSYISELQYGNENISGSKNYWNESSLKISAIEQVNLLMKLDNQQLKFDEKYINAVKDSITLNKSNQYRYSGKTGTGIINGKETNGWFIGTIEKNGKSYYFATHLDSKDNASGKKAKNISEKILEELGLMK